jgi:hypothetical protein
MKFMDKAEFKVFGTVAIMNCIWELERSLDYVHLYVEGELNFSGISVKMLNTSKSKLFECKNGKIFGNGLLLKSVKLVSSESCLVQLCASKLKLRNSVFSYPFLFIFFFFFFFL